MTVSEFINKVGFKVNKSDVQAVNNTIKDIKSTAVKLLGVIGIGFSLSQLRQISEEFNGINDSINYTYKALGNTKEAQQKILDAANATKTSYGTMAGAVTKLTQMNENMFPIDDAVTFSTVVNQLMIASGKSEGEAASAQDMLARALQSNIVDAGTLNRLHRQAPALYNEIANAIGVTSDELQNMAKNGQLTAQQVKDAVINSKEAAQMAFDSLDFSISDAMTNIRNQWGFFVDDFNSTLGITQTIAKGMVSGFSKVMGVLKQGQQKLMSFADKVGGVDNLLKILALTAGVLFVAFNFSKIASGIKMVTGLLHGISLKAAVIIGVIVLLALLVEDFVNFMQGNNSLIGSFLEKAGIDCDEVRGQFMEFWEALKQVIGTARELGQELGGKLAAALATMLSSVMSKIVELLPKIIALLGPITDLVSTIIETVFSVADAVLPALIEVIGIITEILLDAATTVLPVIIDLINDILPIISDFAQQLMPLIVETIRSLAPVIQQVVTIATKLVAAVLKPIINAVSKLLPLVIRIVEALLPALIGIIEAILPPIEAIIDALGPVISTILDVVISLVEMLVNTLLPPLIDIINLLVPIITDVLSLVAELVNAVLPVVIALIEVITPILQLIIETLTPLLKIITRVVSTVVQAVSKVIGTIKKVISAVLDVVKNIIKSIGNVSKKFESVYQFIINLFIGIIDWFAGIFEGAVNAITSAWSAVVEFFTGIWQGIMNVFIAVGEWFGGIFADAWTAITNVWSAVIEWFAGIWQGICDVFNVIVEWFSNIFTEAWEAIKSVFEPVGEFFSGLWETIKEKFTTIGTAIGNAIGEAFATVVNAIIDFAEGTINFFIRAINGAIKLINKIPGVEIGLIQELEIPRLAEGGYVEANKPQHAIIGDNKTEGEIVSPVSKMRQTMLEALSIFMPHRGQFGGTSALTGASTSNRSVTQNVEINNTFNGDKAIQQKAAATMDRSAKDVTSQLARGLAYTK